MYVLMVVPSDFPDGDAGAVRDLSFAKIYMELGYEVILVGRGQKKKTGEYQKVQFNSIYIDKSGLGVHAYRFMMYPIKYIKMIHNIISRNGLPSLIHINDVPKKVINFLLDISMRNGIPIFHDSTEWYSPCEFKKGKYDKAYILKDRLNKKIIRRPIKVYSISTYLDNYYRNKGIDSIRIPVIMDVQNSKYFEIANADKVRIIYAGSPGGKDEIIKIVLGVEALNEDEKKRIEFNIYGISEEQFASFAGISNFSKCISFHGRVSREVVKEALLQSDFSLLLRPSDERYSMAGFPTKSVEAMAHGVAMICNVTSDLGLYLKDMYNAVIIDEDSIAAVTDSLRRALKIDREQINCIKKNARSTAENNFDFRLWMKVIEEFINGGKK